MATGGRTPRRPLETAGGRLGLILKHGRRQVWVMRGVHGERCERLLVPVLVGGRLQPRKAGRGQPLLVPVVLRRHTCWGQNTHMGHNTTIPQSQTAPSAWQGALTSTMRHLHSALAKVKLD